MKWILITAISAALLSVSFIKRARNNVCKTFEDYYSDRDSNDNCYYNADIYLSVPEVIRGRGYPAESHHVTTEDGYILTVFRIPHGKSVDRKGPRQPVFLQHGIALNSGMYVHIGEKSLGFILADAGFDVWLGNFRGTAYSRKHTQLNDTESKFWDFTIHELGIYDIPAQLDLITDITKQKVVVIGYSLGATASYIYSTTYPEAAQEKIKTVVSLAPAVFLKEWKSLNRHLFWMWLYGEPVIDALTNGEVYLRFSAAGSFIKELVCLPFPFQMKMCQIIDMISCGFDYEQNDPETLPVTLLQNTDATSVRTVTHLIQLSVRGNFAQYDYGTEGNKKLYGSPEPLSYNISKLTIPTYLVRGPNDLVVVEEGVNKLHAALPKEVNHYDIYTVKYDKFSHCDFFLARDIVPLLYDHLVRFIQRNQ